MAPQWSRSESCAIARISELLQPSGFLALGCRIQLEAVPTRWRERRPIAQKWSFTESLIDEINEFGVLKLLQRIPNDPRNGSSKELAQVRFERVVRELHSCSTRLEGGAHMQDYQAHKPPFRHGGRR